MELKYIIGSVIGWYFISILLMFLLAKLHDSVRGGLEFSRWCDYITNEFEDITHFDSSDAFIQFLVAFICLPLFPPFLVLYLVYAILRAFVQVFIKLPLRLFDTACGILAEKMKG